MTTSWRSTCTPGSCDSCAGLLGKREDGISHPMLGTPHLRPPDTVKHRLMARVEADRRRTFAQRLLVRAGVELTTKPVLAVAAVLVVALVLASMWNESRPESPVDYGVTRPPRRWARGENDQLFLAYSAAAPGLAVEELSATRAADTARGMFLVPRSSNSALLVGIGMPQLPRGQTYGVWFTTEGRRYRAGTLKVDADGHGYVNLRLFVPLSWIDAVSVTIEEDALPGERLRGQHAPGTYHPEGRPVDLGGIVVIFDRWESMRIAPLVVM